MPEQNLDDLLSVAAAIGTDPDAYAKHLQTLPRPHRVAKEIYTRLWAGAGGFCTLLGQAWSALDEITDRTEFADPYGDGKPDPAIIAQLRERITERIAQAQEIAKAISPFVRKIVADLDGLHTELKGVVDNPAAWATKLRKVLSDLNAAIVVASESLPAPGYHYRDDMLQKRITDATDRIQPLASQLGECAGLLANVVVPDGSEAEADGPPNQSGDTGKDLASTIRRQVKAEFKSHLEDDVLVAAYKTHGSCRKAADALTKDRGTRISKDAVWRAVQRAKDVVARTESSASVRRSVSSQRRDGKRIIQ